MDRDLSEQHQANAGAFGSDSNAPADLHEELIEFEELETESLMQALTRFITIDEEAQTVSGCENDFRHTEAILAAHGQEESAPEVLALLNKQGAFCDCEVLLNSRIDLVFIEADYADYDEDEEEEEG